MQKRIELGLKTNLLKEIERFKENLIFERFKKRFIPMKKILLFVLFTVSAVAQQKSIETWLTRSDKSVVFEKQATTFVFTHDSLRNKTLPVIFVDDTKKYQSMDGFGYTLTGGSATLLNKMLPENRKKILNELFSTNDNGLIISYLRISIGASDLSSHIFSYNDIAEGKTDERIEHFSISEEEKDLLPVLKEIVAINPELKILATSWSPPSWMKSNQNSKGGLLLPVYYDAFALYLVKYVHEMQKNGIRIDALTLQNEPLHPGNNPSLLMYPFEQANFIKNSLGPLFKKDNVTTKILVYDHNADRPDYPLQILNDVEASKYIDGSAFHLYGGSVEAIGEVHEAFPDKNVYFTEQWTGAKGTFSGDLMWHIKTLIIGATRQWCKTVLEWNLAADPQFEPHTDGGCTECLGALTINGNEVQRNVAYYIIAHASKFVRPNSVRIFSNQLGVISNVAFQTPDGKIVMIAINETDSEQVFVIRQKNESVEYRLPAKSVATLVW